MIKLSFKIYSVILFVFKSIELTSVCINLKNNKNPRPTCKTSMNSYEVNSIYQNYL